MSRTHKAPLSDRIAEALRADAASELISNLISETENARSGAEEKRKVVRERALDPLAGLDTASEAKRETDDLGFEVERLDAALLALGLALGEAKARELDERRQTAYDAAKTERDALVEELVAVYPAIETRLADLMNRIAANDRRLDEVNLKLPSGAPRLAGVDEVARGGSDMFRDRDQYLASHLTRAVRLPRFGVDPRDPWAWPRKGIQTTSA
jgi:hypothetical protein